MNQEDMVGRSRCCREREKHNLGRESRQKVLEEGPNALRPKRNKNKKNIRLTYFNVPGFAYHVGGTLDEDRVDQIALVETIYTFYSLLSERKSFVVHHSDRALHYLKNDIIIYPLEII